MQLKNKLKLIKKSKQNTKYHIHEQKSKLSNQKHYKILRFLIKELFFLKNIFLAKILSKKRKKIIIINFHKSLSFLKHHDQ